MTDRKCTFGAFCDSKSEGKISICKTVTVATRTPKLLNWKTNQLEVESFIDFSERLTARPDHPLHKFPKFGSQGFPLIGPARVLGGNCSPTKSVRPRALGTNSQQWQVHASKGQPAMPKRGLVEGLVHHTDAYEQEEHPPRDGHVLEFHTTNPTEAVV